MHQLIRTGVWRPPTESGVSGWITYPWITWANATDTGFFSVLTLVGSSQWLFVPNLSRLFESTVRPYLAPANSPRRLWFSAGLPWGLSALESHPPHCNIPL